MGGETSKQSKEVKKRIAEFKAISASFRTFEDLENALRRAGLESSQVIIGIDTSKSNAWTGEKSYPEMTGLHDIRHTTPYERIMQLVLPTLMTLDDDKVIQVFRFGCVQSRDRSVLPFALDGNPNCHGVQAVMDTYRRDVGLIQMAGPTTLAPMIETAAAISRQNQEYTILLLITDGDVAAPRRDAAAIVQASLTAPLSIITCGVGDGPFEVLEHFDDRLEERQFDNFNFVNFSALEKTFAREERPDLKLATELLCEIPEQFKAVRKLNLLGNQ